MNSGAQALRNVWLMDMAPHALMASAKKSMQALTMKAIRVAPLARPVLSLAPARTSIAQTMINALDALAYLDGTTFAVSASTTVTAVEIRSATKALAYALVF